MLKNKMEKYLIIFFIYAFAGWTMETVGASIREKRFINRGFLIGPLCPVYGVGVSLITFFLQKYVDDIIILFFMSVLIAGTLEYLTSYVMEKIFHARWWDYHNKRFNINGRVCLETLVPFGLVGSLIVKYVSPFLFKYIYKIPQNIRLGILGIFVVLLVIDVIVSFRVIFKLRKNIKDVEKEVKDNTEEIVKKVKEETERVIGEKIEILNEIKYSIDMRINESRKERKERFAKIQEKLIKDSKLAKRLFDSFPSLEIRTVEDKKKDKNNK